MILPNNPTPDQMDEAMRIETLKKQWKSKQISWKEIPFDLREKVTGINPAKAITK